MEKINLTLLVVRQNASQTNLICFFFLRDLRLCMRKLYGFGKFAIKYLLFDQWRITGGKHKVYCYDYRGEPSAKDL